MSEPESQFLTRAEFEKAVAEVNEKLSMAWESIAEVVSAQAGLDDFKQMIDDLPQEDQDAIEGFAAMLRRSHASSPYPFRVEMAVHLVALEFSELDKKSQN